MGAQIGPIERRATTGPPGITARSCRNEYFLPAHIYTPDGILTHGLLTVAVITTQHFPSFW